MISHNTFVNVWSPFTQNENVRAIFLDDHASGFTILGNTFTNCSDAILIGGQPSSVHKARLAFHAPSVKICTQSPALEFADFLSFAWFPLTFVLASRIFESS